LYFPVEHWPEIDRARWLAAQEPAGFLEADKPASHWSTGRRGIVEAAYGRWLSFLDRSQALEASSAPGDRATEDHLREFVADLQGRMAPMSVSMTTGALLRMLAVLEPERDWTLLRRLHRHLKRKATLSYPVWLRRPTCSPSAFGSWRPGRMSDRSRCTRRHGSAMA
jgi:hypothetical protein